MSRGGEWSANQEECGQGKRERDCDISVRKKVSSCTFNCGRCSCPVRWTTLPVFKLRKSDSDEPHITMKMHDSDTETQKTMIQRIAEDT